MRRWGLSLRGVTARSSGVIAAAAVMGLGIAARQAVADPGAPVSASMSGSPLSGIRSPVAVAYVVNLGSGTVTPISTATNRAGKAIRTGRFPGAVAIAPDGKTVYVANGGSSTVTPIRTATNTAGTAIKVGSDPVAIAITP